MKTRTEFLETEYNIKDRYENVDEILEHPLLKDWQDFEKHFLENLKKGNKEQYASRIPHIQVYLKGEQEYKKVKRIL